MTLKKYFHPDTHPALPDILILRDATCYLMTYYAKRPRYCAAQGVVHHLKMLISHPDFGKYSKGFDTYQELLRQWQEIVQRHELRRETMSARNSFIDLH